MWVSATQQADGKIAAAPEQLGATAFPLSYQPRAVSPFNAAAAPFPGPSYQSTADRTFVPAPYQFPNGQTFPSDSPPPYHPSSRQSPLVSRAIAVTPPESAAASSAPTTSRALLPDGAPLLAARRPPGLALSPAPAPYRASPLAPLQPSTVPAAAPDHSDQDSASEDSGTSPTGLYDPLSRTMESLALDDDDDLGPAHAPAPLQQQPQPQPQQFFAPAAVPVQYPRPGVYSPLNPALGVAPQAGSAPGPLFLTAVQRAPPVLRFPGAPSGQLPSYADHVRARPGFGSASVLPHQQQQQQQQPQQQQQQQQQRASGTAQSTVLSSSPPLDDLAAGRGTPGDLYDAYGALGAAQYTPVARSPQLTPPLSHSASSSPSALLGTLSGVALPDGYAKYYAAGAGAGTGTGTGTGTGPYGACVPPLASSVPSGSQSPGRRVRAGAPGCGTGAGRKTHASGLGAGGRYAGPECCDHGPGPDVAGRVLELCETQEGCRYLQRVVETGSADDVLVVFRSVIADLCGLMCDSLANYICQKLFEHCDERQHLLAIQVLANDVVEVARNVHGTRALQKLIDTLTTGAEMAAMREVLAPHVFLLVQDGNGNHVVQRVMNRFTPEYNQFVYDVLTNDALIEAISMHRHGCCVMQRALDYASDAQKTCMISKVIEYSFSLVKDAYGNYVVQYVLEMPLPGIATRFTRTLHGRFIELAKQKFSSNVVEKIMNKGEKEALDTILDEIISCRDMAVLLQDPYANYVVQTALVTANDVQHKQLVALIVPHLALLRNTVYGKRIMAKLYRDTGPAPSATIASSGPLSSSSHPVQFSSLSPGGATCGRHSAPLESGHGSSNSNNPRGSPMAERKRSYHSRQ